MEPLPEQELGAEPIDMENICPNSTWEDMETCTGMSTSSGGYPEDAGGRRLLKSASTWIS